MSDRNGERQAPGHEGIWPALNRFVLTLIILAALIPIGYAFLPEMQRRREAEAYIEKKREEIEVEQMKLTRLLREEDRLKHDPEYMATIARDSLDLMKPGEVIVRLDAQPASAR